MLNEQLTVPLPPGGQVVYTITASVDTALTRAATVNNIASETSEGVVCINGNDTESTTTCTAAVSNGLNSSGGGGGGGGNGGASNIPVPALDTRGLALLALLLGGLAYLAQRKNKAVRR